LNLQRPSPGADSTCTAPGRTPGSFTIPALTCLILALLVSISPPATARQGRFYTLEDFLAAYLTPEPTTAETLWLTPDLRRQAEAVLGHRFPALRLRYWRNGERSAWILDEIGKEMPITMGVVVNDNRIENLVILEYRESRGGEITYPFFTRQFQQLGLTADGGDSVQHKVAALDGQIDGITGATLSVRAATKVATLALLLHRQVFSDRPPAGLADDGSRQR